MMAEISSKAVNKLVYNFKYDLPDFSAMPQRFNGRGVHLKKGFYSSWFISANDSAIHVNFLASFCNVYNQGKYIFFCVKKLSKN